MFDCFAKARDADPSSTSAAALTHKIKLSHCYFFSPVVIGWQCRSIRDQHDIAIHQARRAAMAKRRKKAAKKAAKKTKRRKKK